MATLSNRLPFYKSFRFKLTFLYSLILYLFSGALVFAFNVYINTYLKRDPDIQEIRVIGFPPPVLDTFSELQLDEKIRIRQIRLNDLKMIQEVSVLALAPLAVASFFTGYYISGRFLSPLGKLRTTIEDLETKDLGIQLKSVPDDEVGAVIQSFNSLSARLQGAFQAQEQFVQDASHEIRTPLTIIQTNIDTVLDDTLASKEDMKSAMRDALGGVKQLNKLVNYLLLLTKEEKITAKPVDLTALINQVAATFRLPLKNEGLELQIETRQIENLRISGDQELLERVFFNLIENAIKYRYSKKSSIISIVATINQQWAIITFTNASEELNQTQLTRIFERFYQVDPSRNKKNNGYGLGLAIAKKIITEHNGTLTAHYQNGEISFSVSLPIG